MTIGLLLVLSGVGVAYLCPCNASWLAQLLYWKEEKEGMECCSSLFVLDYL